MNRNITLLICHCIEARLDLTFIVHLSVQHVAVPVSGNIATLTTGPVSPGGTTTLSPEVIIMDESTHQPINLNIIPRMITPEQVSSPHASHATLVAATEEDVPDVSHCVKVACSKELYHFVVLSFSKIIFSKL